MKKIIKKNYSRPVIQVVKVEMEACISSVSNFINNNRINRRWGSVGKYSENIKNNKKDEII
ncbi:hypothetical protein [Elizabethkingia anophelis]|nr:hypothetical protein [Elizabethkingia anophelis]AQW90086.1 hypothetical protein BBD28_05190 [Elizabethkingia anophelis]KUY23749.1 hypothetical protein ATB94_13720 [Elizabethkingia anophelis]